MRKGNIRAILKAILALKSRQETITAKALAKESGLSLYSVYQSSLTSQYRRVNRPRVKKVKKVKTANAAPSFELQPIPEKVREAVVQEKYLPKPEEVKQAEQAKEGFYFVRLYHESASGSKTDICIRNITRGKYKKKLGQTMEIFLSIMKDDEEDQSKNQGVI